MYFTWTDVLRNIAIFAGSSKSKNELSKLHETNFNSLGFQEIEKVEDLLHTNEEDKKLATVFSIDFLLFLKNNKLWKESCNENGKDLKRLGSEVQWHVMFLTFRFNGELHQLTQGKSWWFFCCCKKIAQNIVALEDQLSDGWDKDIERKANKEEALEEMWKFKALQPVYRVLQYYPHGKDVIEFKNELNADANSESVKPLTQLEPYKSLQQKGTTKAREKIRTYCHPVRGPIKYHDYIVNLKTIQLAVYGNHEAIHELGKIFNGVTMEEIKIQWTFETALLDLLDYFKKAILSAYDEDKSTSFFDDIKGIRNGIYVMTTRHTHQGPLHLKEKKEREDIELVNCVHLLINLLDNRLVSRNFKNVCNEYPDGSCRKRTREGDDAIASQNNHSVPKQLVGIVFPIVTYIKDLYHLRYSQICPEFKIPKTEFEQLMDYHKDQRTGAVKCCKGGKNAREVTTLVQTEDICFLSNGIQAARAEKVQEDSQTISDISRGKQVSQLHINCLTNEGSLFLSTVNYLPCRHLSSSIQNFITKLNDFIENFCTKPIKLIETLQQQIADKLIYIKRLLAQYEGLPDNYPSEKERKMIDGWNLGACTPEKMAYHLHCMNLNELAVEELDRVTNGDAGTLPSRLLKIREMAEPFHRMLEFMTLYKTYVDTSQSPRFFNWLETINLNFEQMTESAQGCDRRNYEFCYNLRNPTQVHTNVNEAIYRRISAYKSERNKFNKNIIVAINNWYLVACNDADSERGCFTNWNTHKNAAIATIMFMITICERAGCLFFTNNDELFQKFTNGESELCSNYAMAVNHAEAGNIKLSGSLETFASKSTDNWKTTLRLLSAAMHITHHHSYSSFMTNGFQFPASVFSVSCIGKSPYIVVRGDTHGLVETFMKEHFDKFVEDFPNRYDWNFEDLQWTDPNVVQVLFYWNSSIFHNKEGFVGWHGSRDRGSQCDILPIPKDIEKLSKAKKLNLAQLSSNDVIGEKSVVFGRRETVYSVSQELAEVR